LIPFAEAQADEEDDSDASGPESQDEGDFGRGRRLGGGFTSAVSLSSSLLSLLMAMVSG
jgi:hypothetical protein